MFIALLESTINIHHVTSAVKAEFGDEDVVMTLDGLAVHAWVWDSSGTWEYVIQGESKLCMQ